MYPIFLFMRKGIAILCAMTTCRSSTAYVFALVILFFITLVAHQNLLYAQGCVAAPNNPCAPIIPGDFMEQMSMANKWIGSVDYRWFESFRHFVGNVEQPQRERLHNNVINDVNTINVSATYGISDSWSATLTFPFIYADRSSLYEHDFTNRHSMHSGGLGDIRLVSDFWLLDPHKHMAGNIALGAGIKFPTGDDKAAEISHRATGPVTRPVDPSIQPGDGGWGIILELQAFQKVFGNLFGYVQGSYMMTPEEQSSTEFTLAHIPQFRTLLTPFRTHNSIPDQYFGRAGLSYVALPTHGLTVSLGARVEGVPSYDAIGGSMGFRRPGCTLSIEPGIAWTGKKNSLSIYAPVAVYRNRERSAPEVELGLPRGDAAFADYSILAAFTHRF